MREAWKHPLRSGTAVLLVLASALQVTLLARDTDLRALVLRLRRGRRFSSTRLDPVFLAALVERLLAYLPPWGLGRCVKRSLLLLHLWSQCGFEARLHIGLRNRSGHAWVTAPGLTALARHDFIEIWRC